jgi:hypothetical protein
VADPAYALHNHIEIAIGESISDTNVYEASNAMGATVTVSDFKRGHIGCLCVQKQLPKEI